MKDNKKYLLILLGIFIVIVFIAYKQVYYFKNYDFKQEVLEYKRKHCNEPWEGPGYSPQYENWCPLNEEDIKDLPNTLDLYTVIKTHFDQDILYDLCMYGPLLILIFGLRYVNKLFKSKFLYYYTSRNKYKDFIKTMILNSYKYVLAIPFTLILIYLLSLTITNHGSNILTKVSIYNTFSDICYNTKYFYLIFICYVTLRYFTLMNIGLIIQSKNRKLLITIIEFYIVYFLLELILENYNECFWLFDMFPKFTSPYYYLLVDLIYFIISFGILIITYKNKEKIMLRIGD